MLAQALSASKITLAFTGESILNPALINQWPLRWISPMGVRCRQFWLSW